ncbi:hypothetical protein GYMLUDRAFT_163834, partial [Collybiopsis luxurians FD-317 M1]
PNSTYTFAFDFVIGKLYANSLLASLNSRKSLRRRDFKSNNWTFPEFSTVLHVVSSAVDDGANAAWNESLRSVSRISCCRIRLISLYLYRELVPTVPGQFVATSIIGIEEPQRPAW